MFTFVVYFLLLPLAIAIQSRRTLGRVSWEWIAIIPMTMSLYTAFRDTYLIWDNFEWLFLPMFFLARFAGGPILFYVIWFMFESPTISEPKTWRRWRSVVAATSLLLWQLPAIVQFFGADIRSIANGYAIVSGITLVLFATCQGMIVAGRKLDVRRVS